MVTPASGGKLIAEEEEESEEVAAPMSMRAFIVPSTVAVSAVVADAV